MARFIVCTVAFVAFASSASVHAKQPPRPHKLTSSEQALVDGLHAIASSTIAQSQGNQVSPLAQPNDPDQGDDNASGVAISKVCNHNNPSAQRSAICPHPNSPP